MHSLPVHDAVPALRAPPMLVLAVLLACQLMLALDGTVIYAALPSLRADLDLSRAGLSWVQNAYLLTFGGMLLLGARTGDIVGHRSVFVVATAVFTMASVIGGLAPSAAWLLAARALQGMAAAFAAPAALALLMIAFPEGGGRVRAIGFYTAMSGVGGALGLVLGGVLTDLLSWRWVLFINLPIGVLLTLIGPYCLHPSARGSGMRFDVPGALTATAGMGLLVGGLVWSATPGEKGAALACLAAGSLLLVAFVTIEQRTAQPIMPPALFASAERMGAYAGKMLLIGGMLGTFFFSRPVCAGRARLQRAGGWAGICATVARAIPDGGIRRAAVDAAPGCAPVAGGRLGGCAGGYGLAVPG